MAESNVSGPWQVECAITAGGDVDVGGNVTGVKAILFTESSLTSTAIAALTSTSALFGGTTGYALVMSSTGKLVMMTPTTSFTFATTSY